MRLPAARTKVPVRTYASEAVYSAKVGVMKLTHCKSKAWKRRRPFGRTCTALRGESSSVSGAYEHRISTFFILWCQ